MPISAFILYLIRSKNLPRCVMKVKLRSFFFTFVYQQNYFAIKIVGSNCFLILNRPYKCCPRLALSPKFEISPNLVTLQCCRIKKVFRNKHILSDQCKGSMVMHKQPQTLLDLGFKSSFWSMQILVQFSTKIYVPTPNDEI